MRNVLATLAILGTALFFLFQCAILFQAEINDKKKTIQTLRSENADLRALLIEYQIEMNSGPSTTREL